MQAINITFLVDVIGALSHGTLRNNIFMADNGLDSQGNGTEALITTCCPGQPVNWVVYAIDVQTPVLIRAITFIDIAKEDDQQLIARAFERPPEKGGDPHWFYWSGIIPRSLKPGLYRYSLKLQMGKGVHSTMSSDAAALAVVKH